MKTQKADIAVMAAMAAVSFTSFFTLTGGSVPAVPGVSVIVGVIWFFVSKHAGRTPFSDSGLDIRRIPKGLGSGLVWILVLLPIALDFAFIYGSRFFAPGLVPHIFERTGFVEWGSLPMLVPQLAILALGEEIAWRAFFLRRMKRHMPVALAVVVNASLFTIGHFSAGAWDVVLFDLASVFIDATIFCVIMHKTDNAWISFISHFACNFASFCMIVLLR